MKERVVIGMSGGVDSSVAAYLLKEQGYDVVALFMRNWHDTTGTLAGDCPWYDDQVFAELVAKRLDLPFHYVDLSVQYGERVVDYMFAEYERGRTPNPDVLCNREIKFDVFLEEALKLGADYVATGHYCRREVLEVDGVRRYRLLAGEDKNKDQSYFLCQLSQEQLSKSLFPIGGMQKAEVREIAKKLKLATAERKDSQGICFVGKVDLPTFLQQKLKSKQGDIIEVTKDWSGYYGSDFKIDKADIASLRRAAKPFVYCPSDGVKVGEHDGAHFYTIGQRKGLNVGGKPEPLFVLAINVERNVVYVGQGQDHPGLFRRGLCVNADEMHWVRPDLALREGEESRFSMRIRYRQPLQGGVLCLREDGGYIVFDEPQRGITAGQFAAWYDREELIGSGVIDK